MKQIPTYILNTEECYMINRRLLDVFKTELAEEAVILKLIPYMEGLDVDLSNILSHPGSNHMTEQIAKADKVRNAAFVGFRDYCKAFIQSSDSAQSSAAEKLVALIRRFGWSLHTQGYTEHTAAQASLIEVLEETEYTEAVTQISANAWLSDMKTSNAAFEEALQLKIVAAAQENIPSIMECKRNMVRYIKPVLHYLAFMADIEPEAYAAIRVKLDEEIEYVSTVAKARLTRKENR